MKMIAGTMIMDLSKASGSLWLNAYGFRNNSLQLLYSHVQGRFRTVKFHSKYSE